MSKQRVSAFVICMCLAVSSSFAVAGMPDAVVLKELDDIAAFIRNAPNPIEQQSHRDVTKSRVSALEVELVRLLGINLPLTCPLTAAQQADAQAFVRIAPSTLAGANAKAALDQHAKILAEMAKEDAAIIALQGIDPLIAPKIRGLVFRARCSGFPELETTLPILKGNPVITPHFPFLNSAIPLLSGNQDITDYASRLNQKDIQNLTALAVKFPGTRPERLATEILKERVRLDDLAAFAAFRAANPAAPAILVIEEREAHQQLKLANQLVDTQAIDDLAAIIESFPDTPTARVAASQIQLLERKFKDREREREKNMENSIRTREFFKANYLSCPKCCVEP